MTQRTHRINLTIPAEVHDSLKDYAEFLGKPVATVAGDLIREMHPSMLAVSRAMKKAKSSKEQGMEELRKIAAEELKATQELLLGRKPEEQTELFNNKQE